MKINELKGLPDKDYFDNLKYNNPWGSDDEPFISGEKSLLAMQRDNGQLVLIDPVV